ncbi:MAG: hypothetical protein KUF82_21365, partial [Candidatus Thiodiazotropha sp. (ex Ctena orbiculata)]|nr:hypothetical protein [Candidatus Thiodiazotropha taylori]
EPTPCLVHPNVKRKNGKKEQKDKKEERKKDKKENKKEIEKDTVQKQSLMKRIRHRLFKKKTTDQKAAPKQELGTSLSGEQLSTRSPRNDAQYKLLVEITEDISWMTENMMDDIIDKVVELYEGKLIKNTELRKSENETSLKACGENKASDQNMIPDINDEDFDLEIENMIKDMLNEITEQYELELIENADREIEIMIKNMLNKIAKQYEQELNEDADKEIEIMVKDMLTEITKQYERELIEDDDWEIEIMVNDMLNEITKQFERELIEDADREIDIMIEDMLNEITKQYERELIEDLEIEIMVKDMLNEITNQYERDLIELIEGADLEIENMIDDMLDKVTKDIEEVMLEGADYEIEIWVKNMLVKIEDELNGRPITDDADLPKAEIIFKVYENQTDNKTKDSGEKQMTDKGINQTKPVKPQSIFALKNQLNAEIIAAFAKKQAQRKVSDNNDQTSTASKANEKDQAHPLEKVEYTKDAKNKVTEDETGYDPEMDIYDRYVSEVVDMVHKVREITKREQASDKKDEFMPEEEMNERLRLIQRRILTDGRGTFWELYKQKISKGPDTRNHQKNLEAVLPNYNDNDIMKLARAMNNGRYQGKLHREYEAWRQAKEEEELRKQQQNHLANIHRKLFDDEDEMVFSDEEEIKREIAEEAKKKQNQKSDQERLHCLFNKFFDDDEDDKVFSDSEEPSDTEKSTEAADKKKPNKNAPNQPVPIKKRLSSQKIIELYWPYNEENRERVIRKEKKWKIDVKASDSKLQDKDFKKVIRQSRKSGLNTSCKLL